MPRPASTSAQPLLFPPFLLPLRPATYAPCSDACGCASRMALRGNGCRECERTGGCCSARLGSASCVRAPAAKPMRWLLEIPPHRQKGPTTMDAVFGRRGREASRDETLPDRFRCLFSGVARERTLGRTCSGAVVCTRRQVRSAATARGKTEAPYAPSIGRFRGASCGPGRSFHRIDRPLGLGLAWPLSFSPCCVRLVHHRPA